MDLLSYDDGKRESVESEDLSVNQYDKTLKALVLYNEANKRYVECKTALEYKKATLQTKTDWGVALPEHKRPTVGDKEAYILEVCYEDICKVAKLRAEREFQKELYEVEKIMLQKEEE